MEDERKKKKISMQKVTAKTMRRLAAFKDSDQRDNTERYNWLEWRVLNMISSAAVCGETEITVGSSMMTEYMVEYLNDRGFSVIDIDRDGNHKVSISWDEADVQSSLKKPKQ